MSKVAIIGNGNVGTYFSHVISDVHQVDLFTRKKSTDTLPISELTPNSYDIIIITVPDNAIKQVSDSLESSQAVYLHCSGSKSIEALCKHANRGVLYPLQTFSKTRKLDTSDFPILIEGTQGINQKLFDFAKSFHEDVRIVSSKDRLRIHLSAVIACNFSNHLFVLSKQILEETNNRFELLKPLINETVAKAFEIQPEHAQTGPALRKDDSTVNQHLDFIADPKIKMIYKLLTESIQSHATQV